MDFGPGIARAPRRDAFVLRTPVFALGAARRGPALKLEILGSKYANQL
jgi:hypothetical protein